jgi:hypothetical protein
MSQRGQLDLEVMDAGYQLGAHGSCWLTTAAHSMTASYTMLISDQLPAAELELPWGSAGGQ